MGDQLAPCRKCGCDDIGTVCHIGIHESRCCCFCGECETDGPGAPSQEQARAAWNEMQKEVDE